MLFNKKTTTLQKTNATNELHCFLATSPQVQADLPAHYKLISNPPLISLLISLL